MEYNTGIMYQNPTSETIFQWYM